MSTGGEAPAAPLLTPVYPTPGSQRQAPGPTGRRPLPSLLRSSESWRMPALNFPWKGAELTAAVWLVSRVQEGVLQIKGAWAPGWPAALPWRMSPDLPTLTWLLPSGWTRLLSWNLVWTGQSGCPHTLFQEPRHSPRDSATVPSGHHPSATLVQVALLPLPAQPRSLYVHQGFRSSWPLPARGRKMPREAQSGPGGLGSWGQPGRLAQPLSSGVLCATAEPPRAFPDCIAQSPCWAAA